MVILIFLFLLFPSVRTGDFLPDGRYLIKCPGNDSLEIFCAAEVAEGVESFETHDSALVYFPGPLSR